MGEPEPQSRLIFDDGLAAFEAPEQHRRRDSRDGGYVFWHHKYIALFRTQDNGTDFGGFVLCFCVRGKNWAAQRKSATYQII